MEDFEYRIYEDVYNSMVNGNKTIEIRLYNEKSSKIKIGDIGKFVVLDNDSKYLFVKVTNLYRFKNVDELWGVKERVLTSKFNSIKELKKGLYEIFGKEKVVNSEFVGIKFKIISKD